MGRSAEQNAYGDSFTGNKMRDRIYRYANGDEPVPERYFWGAPCKVEDHHAKEQCLRRVNSGACLLCESITTKRSHNKRRFSHRDMTALNDYEERSYRDDPDPLFD